MIDDVDKSKNDILKIRIKTCNLEYECKKLLLREENIIKQAFMIPISNAFETINIEAAVSRE